MERYKNIKRGDWVTCTEVENSNPSTNIHKIYGGAAWKSNYKFKVTHIKKHSNCIVFFNGGIGVYHNSIVPPTDNQYEIY